jgi:hypothetical protein
MDKADMLPSAPEEPADAAQAETPDNVNSMTQSFICGSEATTAAYSQLLSGRKPSNADLLQPDQPSCQVPAQVSPQAASQPPQTTEEPCRQPIDAEQKDPTETNAVFERLLFCKTKVLSGGDRKAQPKLQAKLRKSFWLFPFPARDLGQDEKEEADLLTTFGFNQALNSRLSVKKLGPFEFVYEFFASFKQEQLNFFSFILNNNKQQAAYENCYNTAGLRYFFGCQFLDFEYQSKTDRRTPLDFDLEVSQSLLLFESKYPFRTFFEAILKLVFNIIRVKRLELYAFHYNGNEHDVSNLDHLKKYDCSSVPRVGSTQEILTSVAAPILATLHEQNFKTGVRLTDTCLNQTLEFRPKPILADYYEALESRPK